MILYAPIQSEIEAACNHIKTIGKNPIIYCSQYNAEQLCKIVTDCPSHPEDEIADYSGFTGYYYGCPIYITGEVGDMIVIVPQWQSKE